MKVTELNLSAAQSSKIKGSSVVLNCKLNKQESRRNDDNNNSNELA